MRPCSIVMLGLVVALAPTVGAQDAARWQRVDVARQIRDSLPQRIKVQYAAGRVTVAPSGKPLLYDMHLRYDELRARPLHRHDAELRTTLLGLESLGGKLRSGDNGESGELRLGLPAAVPLDLEMTLGGTEARLELGGLSLVRTRMEFGAADARISFATPNRVRMQELEVSVGAAEFRAEHLGNANADELKIRGGVGGVDLDFSGDWSHDLSVDASIAIGSLTLRVPEDVGIRLEVSRIATTFAHSGLVRRGDAWYSPNFETARYKLRVSARTMLGKIDVRAVAP